MKFINLPEATVDISSIEYRIKFFKVFRGNFMGGPNIEESKIEKRINKEGIVSKLIPGGRDDFKEFKRATEGFGDPDKLLSGFFNGSITDGSLAGIKSVLTTLQNDPKLTKDQKEKIGEILEGIQKNTKKSLEEAADDLVDLVNDKEFQKNPVRKNVLETLAKDFDQVGFFNRATDFGERITKPLSDYLNAALPDDKKAIENAIAKLKTGDAADLVTLLNKPGVKDFLPQNLRDTLNDPKAFFKTLLDASPNDVIGMKDKFLEKKELNEKQQATTETLKSVNKFLKDNGASELDANFKPKDSQEVYGKLIDTLVGLDKNSDLYKKLNRLATDDATKDTEEGTLAKNLLAYDTSKDADGKVKEELVEKLSNSTKFFDAVSKVELEEKKQENNTEIIITPANEKKLKDIGLSNEKFIELAKKAGITEQKDIDTAIQELHEIAKKHRGVGDYKNIKGGWAGNNPNVEPSASTKKFLVAMFNEAGATGVTEENLISNMKDHKIALGLNAKTGLMGPKTFAELVKKVNNAQTEQTETDQKIDPNIKSLIDKYKAVESKDTIGGWVLPKDQDYAYKYVKKQNGEECLYVVEENKEAKKEATREEKYTGQTYFKMNMKGEVIAKTKDFKTFEEVTESDKTEGQRVYNKILTGEKITAETEQ